MQNNSLCECLHTHFVYGIMYSVNENVSNLLRNDQIIETDENIPMLEFDMVFL